MSSHLPGALGETGGQTWSWPSIISQTTNRILSFPPLDRLRKLIVNPKNSPDARTKPQRPTNNHVAPSPPQNSAHHNEMAPETAARSTGAANPRTQTQSQLQTTSTVALISGLAARNRRRLMARHQQPGSTVATKPPTTSDRSRPVPTKLPHVTRADLLNLHQIHAASLNGLAGQQQPSAPFGPATVGSEAGQQQQQQQQPQPAAIGEQNRRPAQPSSINTFVQPPPPPMVQAEQQPARPQSPGARGPQAASTMAPGSRQQTGQLPPNKLTLVPLANQPQQQQPGISYDSSSLATTNSISVHSSQAASTSGLSSPATFAQPSSTTTSTSSHAPSPTTFSAASTSSTLPPTSSSSSGFSQQGGSSQQQQANVLASLAGSSLRTPAHQHHNSLANAKYSLDGIIAVAIFGGFIFLGAIITILVIIIRR